MRRLLFLIVVTLTIGIAMAAWLVLDARANAASSRDIAALTKQDALAADAHIASLSMAGAVRGFLMDQRQTDELARKNAADERFNAAIIELAKLNTDPKRAALIAEIGKADERTLDPGEDRIMALARKDARAAVDMYFAEYAPAQAEQLTRLEALDSREAETQLNAEAEASAFTATLTLWSTIGIFGLLIAGVVLTQRNVMSEMTSAVTDLSEGANEVVTAARQVATSSQSLSQGSTEQAASLEETSASAEELSSMTRQNAANALEAARLTGDLESAVQHSATALGEMVTSVAAIQDSSRQVAKIIKTIDEIAFQTNILALNAAVEAARAGEAGMGFAVVADEVRNLAQRSAQAAKDTATMIEASISRSEAGTQQVERVATAISSLTSGMAKVKSLVDDVNHSSQEQSRGFDQISTAVAQMEKVTQSTAATAEESAAASEELNAQAESTLVTMARLETILGRKAAHWAAAEPQRLATSAPEKRGTVVRMPARPASVARRSRAEDQLPLEDTGTFGTF